MPLVLKVIREDQYLQDMLTTALCGECSIYHWKRMSGFLLSEEDSTWLMGDIFIRVIPGSMFLLQKTDRLYDPSSNSVSRHTHCTYTLTSNKDWMESAAYWLNNELAFSSVSEEQEEVEFRKEHEEEIVAYHWVQ